MTAPRDAIRRPTSPPGGTGPASPAAPRRGRAGRRPGGRPGRCRPPGAAPLAKGGKEGGKEREVKPGRPWLAALPRRAPSGLWALRGRGCPRPSAPAPPSPRRAARAPERRPRRPLRSGGPRPGGAAGRGLRGSAAAAAEGGALGSGGGPASWSCQRGGMPGPSSRRCFFLRRPLVAGRRLTRGLWPRRAAGAGGPGRRAAGRSRRAALPNRGTARSVRGRLAGAWGGGGDPRGCCAGSAAARAWPPSAPLVGRDGLPRPPALFFKFVCEAGIDLASVSEGETS